MVDGLDGGEFTVPVEEDGELAGGRIAAEDRFVPVPAQPGNLQFERALLGPEPGQPGVAVTASEDGPGRVPGLVRGVLDGLQARAGTGLLAGIAGAVPESEDGRVGRA